MYSHRYKVAMTGEQLRSALRKELLVGCLGSMDTFLLEEVGIRHGLARVDFLVVNGLFHGFEIKSNHDALRRLSHQAQIYSSALDRVTLVVRDRHVSKVVRMIPNWWGILVVSQTNAGRFVFSQVRNGDENPNIDKGAIVKFLWRAEALEVLEGLNAATGLRSKPRRALYCRLTECASLLFIRKRIHYYLQQRKAARAARQ
jgi:hypothetical protein